MATSDLARALRVPGTFWVDPTDTSGKSGTPLGAAKEVVARRNVRVLAETAEEWGGEEVEVHYLGAQWFIAASFRGMDSDMLSKVFENVTPASSSEPLARHVWPKTTGTVEGAKMSDRSFSLLFVPEDTQNHHAVYFRTCVAHAVEDLELPLSRDEELVVAVLFRALRDGTNESESVQVCALEDVVL